MAALMVLDPDVAPAWAAQHGIEHTDLQDLATDRRVIAQVEQDLAEVMEPFNRAEQVKRFKLLGDEWATDSDLMTPTSKLKRRGIDLRYAAEIEALYS